MSFQKRAHQSLMDASEGELSSNKRQALQSVNDTPISTPACTNFSFQGNTSNFQSAPVHYSDRSSATEPLGSFNLGDKGVFSLGNENLKSERSHFTNLLQNNSNVSLSMSLAGRDPSYLNVGTSGARINLAGKFTSYYPFPLRLDESTARVEVVTSAGTCSTDNASFISMNKFERGNISFGGFQHDPERNNTSSSGKVISNYGMLISESSASESLIDKTTVEQSANQIETIAPKRTFKTEKVSKEKVQKTRKSSSNNFPTNVKSLLSTGILDGVPVKYVSWCRTKSARGVIKGTGYLCGCNDCKFSKNLNAFQLETHAACKTRHPNNHIYFENGKSIYAVVQELKNIPPEMLFDEIQNITGSPINKKNFQTWKASFQAARHEVAKPV